MRRALAAVVIFVAGLIPTSPLAPADGYPTRPPTGIVEPYDETGIPDPPTGRFIRMQFVGEAGPPSCAPQAMTAAFVLGR